MNKRIISWSLAIVSTGVGVAFNAFIQFSFGLDISSSIILVVFPLGSILISLFCLSGFAVGSKITSLQPTSLDLIFLMVLSLCSAFLIYEYQYIAVSQLVEPSARGSFFSFVVAQVTGAKYEIYMRGMPTDAAPVAAGDAGWFILIIRVASLLAVARSVYSIASPGNSSRWSS